jgi:hypothetical protein
MGFINHDGARIDYYSFTGQLKPFDLVDQEVLVDCASRRQQQDRSRVNHTRWDVSQHVFLAVDPYRVARIGSSTPNDPRCIQIHGGQGNNLALALRAILASDNDCTAHFFTGSRPNIPERSYLSHIPDNQYPSIAGLGFHPAPASAQEQSARNRHFSPEIHDPEG